MITTILPLHMESYDSYIPDKRAIPSRYHLDSQDQVFINIIPNRITSANNTLNITEQTGP